jgi:tetratricopeptide (TPR) repeat protein
MKTVIQGSLQFASEKSFNKALSIYQVRLETYYKNDLAFKGIENFNPELYRFEIARTVVDLSDKFWRNTSDAIEYLAQFAISGRVEAFQLDNGLIIKSLITEPKNDKQISLDYHQARVLLDAPVQDLEKIEVLLKGVLQSFPEHTQALHCMGYTYMKTNRLDEAIEMMNRAVKTGHHCYKIHYLRGLIYSKVGEFEKAVADFDQAIRYSLAIQDMHWKSRLEKARCLIELDVLEPAKKELGYYLARPYKPGSENEGRIREAHYLMGQIALSSEHFEDAVKYFDAAKDHATGEQYLSTAACIYYRGVAKQKSGTISYSQDIERALNMGFLLEVKS